MLLGDGTLVPARCDRLSCWACIIPVAILTGQALAMAAPKQAVVLTGLGRAWPEVQSGMARIRGAFKRRRIQGELAYHVEPFCDPLAETTHCHGWWRGDHLTQAKLSEAATAARLGEQVRVRPATPATRDYAVPTLDYGLKMILKDRPDEINGWWPQATQFLELNNNHLVHSTHGFWQDSTGRKLTLREAQYLGRSPTQGVRPRFMAAP